MSGEQLMLCLLLGIVVVLLVTEWIPLEVTALLTAGTLALTGLVPADEALSGFSSPAVVTIWAVFILSGGLDRTGVADHIGRWVQRCAGQTEIGLIATLMIGAGVMSAFMNNVAVAALLLPVTMDLARRNHIAPSRLLLPLAYGSLLGGLTTMIGTPPNILVSTALRDAGLQPFALFDFTPVGGIILIAGTLFMVLGGRWLLPHRDVASAAVPETHDLAEEYELQERTFALQVPVGSPLAGTSLEDSRLGAAVGLNVIAVFRNGRALVAPHPSFHLAAGDRLFVQGRLERICDVQALINLISKESHFDVPRIEEAGLAIMELCLGDGCPLVGQTLAANQAKFLPDLQVLALHREETTNYENLADTLLRTTDCLLLTGPEEAFADLQSRAQTIACQLNQLSGAELHSRYGFQDHLVRLELVDEPELADIAMEVQRIESILGIKALLVIDRENRASAPEPDAMISVGTQIMGLETTGTMHILHGLESLRVDEEAYPAELLETGQIGLAEATLSPRSGLAGKSLRQLHFREQYGLGVLAIWRAGRAYRSNLRDMPLEFGDALLLLGPRERIEALGRHPELIVLSRSGQKPFRTEKAMLSTVVMFATLLPVLLGLVPIHLAVVLGAACMVMAKCLTMEEAYRAIEWRAVFLIAGLLPLGIALEQSGMATLVAQNVVSLTGGQHPLALMTGLVGLTFLCTCIIPTSALVLLMAPIALQTAAAADLSPQALLMAISMAASASFLTPIAHPANILVMGPGGYRFRDYFLIGLPLTAVVFIIIIWCVPYFWPLTP
jgi:di/tricarboxylate transporter